MGVNTDAMRAGVAFTPSVGELAALFADWRPRHNSPDEIDLPGSESWSLLHWAATKDCVNHLDLTDEFDTGF